MWYRVIPPGKNVVSCDSARESCPTGLEEPELNATGWAEGVGSYKESVSFVFAPKKYENEMKT
jgi:hypothetical protein